MPAIASYDEREQYRLRRADVMLTEEHLALQTVLRSALSAISPSTRVRNAEPSGVDPTLWDELRAHRLIELALPEAVGGEGAAIVELTLLGEEVGRHLLPFPLVEHVVATRLVHACGGTPDTEAIRGLSTDGHPERRLVVGGAVADEVVWGDGHRVLVLGGGPRPLARNHGSLPLAWWSVTDGEQRSLPSGAGGALLATARAEWMLATAATLVGIADAALAMAVSHATERIAFGVPIGTFQGVSHPLASVAIEIDAARKLTWKSAWFVDNEPASQPWLVPMAVVAAADAANVAVRTGVHVLGGIGVTSESDMQLYFRRAAALTVLLGDRRRHLADIARLRLGATGATAGG